MIGIRLVALRAGATCVEAGAKMISTFISTYLQHSWPNEIRSRYFVPRRSRDRAVPPAVLRFRWTRRTQVRGRENQLYELSRHFDVGCSAVVRAERMARTQPCSQRDQQNPTVSLAGRAMR